ncbi:MAG: hypothetical protein AAGJ32_03450 [Pseudomonadota bacterium]
MLKSFPVAFVALLIAVSLYAIAKNPIAMALNASAATSAPVAPDYAQTTSWITRPDTPPPSVWEAGWDVDLFLLPPWPKAWAAPGTIDPRDGAYRRAQTEALADIREAWPAEQAVYSPALRVPSPASRTPDWIAAQADLEAATETYFEDLNTGRAVAFVVPAGAGELIPALKAALAARSDLERSRVISITALGTGDPALDAALEGCSFGDGCPDTLPVHTAPTWRARVAPQPPGGVHPFRTDDRGALSSAYTSLKARWLSHLNENVSKPAEPLGDFETIGLAPIHTADGARIDE